MSNNKEQGSARDYIKSYVKESNTEDYLQKEQPRYDPTKPIQSPQPTPVEQESLPEPVQTSEHASQAILEGCQTPDDTADDPCVTLERPQRLHANLLHLRGTSGKAAFPGCYALPIEGQTPAVRKLLAVRHGHTIATCCRLPFFHSPFRNK